MKFKNWKNILAMTPFVIATPLIITSCSDNNTTYTIFHTNDVHGRLLSSTEKYNEWMGLEKISTYVKSNSHDLLLDAGDLIQGLPISNLDSGATTTKVADYIGYDYKAIGNHEFDFGFDNLKKITGLDTKDKEDINYLANNIVYKNKQNETVFDPYDIVSLNDGTKVGLIGIATPETLTKTHPKNVTDVDFTNPIDATKTSVEALQKEGIDIIIAISHLGLDQTSEFTSEKLAKEVDGLDLIIDGHSHTELKEALEIKKENQPNSTYIVQTGSYSINLGQVQFQLSEDKKILQNVNAKLISHKDLANISGDSKVKEIVKPIQDAYKVESEKEAFSLPDKDYVLIATEGSEAKTRQLETNLGSMFTDAIVYEARDIISKSNTTPKAGETVSKIDFGFINGGTFRANIAGKEKDGKYIVTNGDVDATSPFGNTLEVLKLTGAEVYKMFEHSAKKVNGGPFLQVSKEVEVVYEDTGEKDPEKPDIKVHKVKSLKINGTEVTANSTETYYVASNDFLTAGGDGYEMLKGKSTGIQGASVSEPFKKYGQYLSSKETTNPKAQQENTSTWNDYKEKYPAKRIKFESKKQ